ncbi:hypothetical protein Ciccas_011335 [Cichlidogyrus casuarinus]|uniref:Uncharacterized protein n=1 Tax=Cichlidogyrus casuarinus TaxID=1844966 RepID=A0ABD2PUG0_9PLAT
MKQSYERQQQEKCLIDRTEKPAAGSLQAASFSIDNLMEPKDDDAMYPVSMHEINEQTEELRDLLHNRMPAARRTKKELKARFKWFDSLSKEAERVEREWQELKCVQESRATLQYLLALKSNSSSLRRIFHGIEIERYDSIVAKKKSPNPAVDQVGKAKQVDTMEVAMKWVAKNYRGAWQKLFYCLPFRPARGDAELDEIICKIYCNMVRGDKRELVYASLATWRRMDVCANLGSIWLALNELGEVHSPLLATTRGRRADDSKNELARAFKVKLFVIILCKVFDQKKFKFTISRGLHGRKSSLTGHGRQPPMSALSKSIQRITGARLKQLREEALLRAAEEKDKSEARGMRELSSSVMRLRPRKLSSRFLRRLPETKGMPIALTFTSAELAAANRIAS